MSEFIYRPNPFTVERQITSVDDLYNCKPDELERQANLLLYGRSDILEEAMEKQIFYQMYIPRNLTTAIDYELPKWIRMKLICVNCGRVRSDGSGQLCRYCYVLRTRLRFYDAREGYFHWDNHLRRGWENGERVGVVLPTTEWWDERDLPAKPRRIAFVTWEDK